MAALTVLNITSSPLIIDTAGHVIPGRDYRTYDTDTITPANFIILQFHINAGRLRVVTGDVTLPPPVDGAYLTSVVLQGSQLVFTDSEGQAYPITLPAAASGAVTSVANKTGAVSLAKADVGLDKVDNTADTAKPISSAASIALAGKANSSHTHNGTDITAGIIPAARLGTGVTDGTTILYSDGTWKTPPASGGGGTITSVTASAPLTSTGGSAPQLAITAASTTAAGSMSAADKTKLDGVAAGATALTIGTTATTAKVGNYVPTWTEVTGKPSTFAPTAHTHDAADVISGVFPPARLGTGTASSSTVLYGDGTYKTPPAGGTGGTPDPAAVASLADMHDLLDDPVINGIAIGSRSLPSAVSAAYACIDLESAPLGNAVPFTLEAWRNNARVSIATATVAAGAYRAVFASTVAYQAGDIISLVPGASGGTGGTLRHQLGAAWTIPSGTLNKPTGVSVTDANGTANVTWVAPTTGITPQQYTLYRNPANGSAPYAVLSRVRGLAATIYGHAAGDRYAVESVIPGLGSGLTLYYSSAGDGTAATPTFTTADSSTQSSGTAISTTSGDFIATNPGSGASATYGTGGVRVLTDGTTTTSQQGVRIVPLGVSDGTGGFIFKDKVYFPDTTATAWLIFSSDSDPVTGGVTTTRYIRLEAANASFTVRAKAPGVVFGAGTSGASALVYKSGGTTTSTTVASTGSAGVTYLMEFKTASAGAMTLNVYTAAVTDFATATPTTASTLAATFDLTAAQVSALFGGSGSPVALTTWEASGDSTTTAKTVNFGPQAALRIGSI